MNGPDHYTLAEQLLEQARNNSGENAQTFSNLAAAAQAHATLALAAAVVDSHDAKPETPDGWRRDLVQIRAQWDDDLNDDRVIPISGWAHAFFRQPPEAGASS